jgi:hypothetical protein
MPPHHKSHLVNALERLVQYFEETGKQDDLDRWRMELEASQKVEAQP